LRILFGGHSLANPRGGGELSARTLLTHLASSHQVEAVGVGRESRDYVVGSVRCRDYRVTGWPAPAGVPFHMAAMLVEARFRQTLARHVREGAPDLVLLQQPGCLDPLDLPPQTKLIVFLRSLVCYGAGDANPARWRRIFVGLDEWKGAQVALRLAESLPERRFLFLAGARDSARVRARAGRLENVACAGWTEEMGRVFARTRILLMPSIWEEPFGRLPVEAGACGVPTLASARGGLREAVGDGGLVIDPVDDLSQWIRCIEQLDDPELYASLSAAARRHAATLGLDVTLKRFGDLVRRELAMELWAG
jgi:glycosyltransferase involved in cell wall biosynthesis